MKRALIIICLAIFTISASTLQGGYFKVGAAPIHGRQVEVIIQTDGATQGVMKQVTKLGGTIKYAYQNAPVLAVSLPAEGLNALYNHPNVTNLTKDHPIVLLDAQQREGTTEQGNFYPLDSSGLVVNSINPSAIKADIATQGYGGFLVTGAIEIWDGKNYGDGSVVAVVDTGTVPNLCLKHAVIGAPGFPEGYNATRDGIPATDPKNKWHGTHIGGVIASACGLDFSGEPENPLNRAVATYLSWKNNQVYIFGQAPGAKIYPVKIFEADKESTSTAIVMDALDHLLTLKRSGDLDIDVVNLSFGGTTGFEGRAILDTFLEQFIAEDILVVAAAGNNGPLPNSIASPASSDATIAVGALDYAAISRVFYEYTGLAAQPPREGQGMVLRPTDELRVADLSSRGPLSDGRSGPDMVAPGTWSFQTGPENGFQWDLGTSYAAAAVSGAAALIKSKYKTDTGIDPSWLSLRNALLLSADREVIGEAWRDRNISGYGALNSVAALELLKSGETLLPSPDRSNQLRSNILANPNSAQLQLFDSGGITLKPSHSYDTLLDITPSTNNVTIQVYDIITPDNSAYSLLPNSLKVIVQSAKRSAARIPLFRYWEPHKDGDNFTITIEDGDWTFNGVPVAHQPMEPGLMKVSLMADYANESPVSFKVRISRLQDPAQDDDKQFAQSVIKMGDVIDFEVDIPTGTSKASFNLAWNRDWLKFPTSDMDMLVIDPAGELASQDGATWNAPEQVVITDPEPGTWRVRVEAREVYKTDLFRLYLQMESATATSSQFDIISQHPVADSTSGTGDDTPPPYTLWIPIVP